MKNIVLKLILFTMVAVATFTSCDSDPTLQSYIVDSSEKEGFITTSIPKTILGIDDSKMTAESRKAYNSVHKVNILAYRKTDENQARFEKESETLDNILNSDQYTLLMSHNQDDMKVKFLYQGDKKSIDEIIVFGVGEKAGLMGVARILGDDMNIANMLKMMKELEKSEINPMGMVNILKGIGVDVQGDGEIDQEAVKEILESKGIDTSAMEMN